MSPTRLETDLEAEIEAKEKEVEWIQRVARDLEGEPGVAEKADETERMWNEVKSLWQLRQSRIEEAKAEAKRLGDDLSELREWIKELEKKANRPVSVLDTSEKEFKKKRKEYLDLQKRVKKKAAKAEQVMNRCDKFFGGQEVINNGFDVLRTTNANLRKRWVGLCAKAKQRPEELDKLWEDWNKFNSDYDKLQGWLLERTEALHRLDTGSENGTVPYQELESIGNQLEAMKAEQESRLGELDSLNDQYCDMAREYRLDTSDDLKTKFIKANNDWEDLSYEIEAMLKRLRHGRQLYENYRSIREREMNWLCQMDAQLTELEVSSTMPREERRTELARLRSEMEGRNPRLDQVVESGTHLVQRSQSDRDAEHIEDLSAGFADLRADVGERMYKLVDELQPTEDDFVQEDDEALVGASSAPLPPISVNTSVQVSTLKFERDTGSQTLLTQSVTSSVPDSGIGIGLAASVSPAATDDLSSAPSPRIAGSGTKNDEEEYEDGDNKVLDIQAVASAASAAAAASNARLKEDSRLKSRGSLESDLDKYLAEFHRNGDQLEDAIMLREGERLAFHDMVRTVLRQTKRATERKLAEREIVINRFWGKWQLNFPTWIAHAPLLNFLCVSSMCYRPIFWPYAVLPLTWSSTITIACPRRRRQHHRLLLHQTVSKKRMKIPLSAGPGFKRPRREWVAWRSS